MKRGWHSIGPPIEAVVGVHANNDRYMSLRPTVALSDTNCVNYDNITCVSVTPSPLMDRSEPGVDVDVVVSPVSPANNKRASSRVVVPVKLGIVNARSICNKTDVFTDYVTEVNMDLIAITETWLNIGEKDNRVIKHLTHADYKFVHLPRKSRRGGGVGLVYRSSFKVVVNRRDDMKSFEFMDVDVSSSGNSMKLVITYRPPPSKKNEHSYADFLVEFTGFIEHYALMTTRFAIVGDFNIHWDVPSDNNVKRFADLLESLNIIQHVHAPTHIDGHTIDLILTPSGNHGITSTKTTLLLSDHLWVECLVDMVKPVVPRKTITYRKYKAINKPAFCSDIASSLPTAISSGKQTTTELANHYNVVLTKLIEKHAPLQTCRIADRPLVPWYNKKVIKAKQIRRQCERKWRHTSLQVQVHREIYKTHAQR